MLVPAGSPIFFLREHRFAVRCRVVTLRQLLRTLCMLLFMLSTSLLHIFLYIFFINIGYASCNSISPFYDVCNCFIICHLIITRILAAELNYRFTNSKTSLAIVIQYSLQEEESRNVSSELVHYNHKILAIYLYTLADTLTHTPPPSSTVRWQLLSPDALERWWQHTNCSTHCTRDMSQTSRDTSYSIASFIFKVVSKNKG